jgi:hypothetical protein
MMVERVYVKWIRVFESLAFSIGSSLLMKGFQGCFFIYGFNLLLDSIHFHKRKRQFGPVLTIC